MKNLFGIMWKEMAEVSVEVVFQYLPRRNEAGGCKVLPVLFFKLRTTPLSRLGEWSYSSTQS